MPKKRGFSQKKPAIGGNARAFREKKPRTGPLRLQSGGGGEPEEPGVFCLRRRETGRMPNQGLILFVIREK